jgi:hypothetical protein
VTALLETPWLGTLFLAFIFGAAIIFTEIKRNNTLLRPVKAKRPLAAFQRTI